MNLENVKLSPNFEEAKEQLTKKAKGKILEVLPNKRNDD